MKTYDQATEFIETEAIAIWKQYQAIYNCGEMPPVTCEIENSKTAGFAYYNQAKGIKLNLAFFCTHANELDLKETIAHELAHIVQFRCFPKAKQAHGTEFRFVMQSIGYSGNTYHYMDPGKAKAAIKAIQKSIISSDDF